MQFNSIEFAIFLPIVFLFYWALAGRNAAQNRLLVVASYFFYGWWDWRFLFLIAFSSLLDYFIGSKITEASANQKKRLLLLSVLVNIGFLGFFKYYNFFASSFVEAFTLMGQTISLSSLSIVLPVGISFYTFQTLSYTIDIYKGKMEPATDLVAYLAYVSFFPQLVAGPIERATNFLPQFYQSRKFEYHSAVDGLRQIMWGLFKKIVVADNCAGLVDEIFFGYENFSASTRVVGIVLFAFQIYGDFSGYSDMAIGTAKLFGFRLRQNFALPYFSRDVAEFWRRWHISLTTWFRDYLYIPLGGSRGGRKSQIRNTILVFLVSGFWHGANWTFLAWGALNAIYFLPLLLLGKNRKYQQIIAPGQLPRFREIIGMVTTFGLITFSWTFFRAPTVSDAFSYITGMFSLSLLSIPEFDLTKVGVAIILLITAEWLTRAKEHPLQYLEKHFSRSVRWTFYLLIGGVLFYLGNFEDHTFIYFQF